MKLPIAGVVVVALTLALPAGADAGGNDGSAGTSSDVETDGESEGGFGPATIGAAVGAVAGAVAGATIAAGVVTTVFVVAGVPNNGDPNSANPIVAATPLYVFPLVALPSLGASIGVVVAGLMNERALGALLVEALVAGVAATCGMVVCFLPSWWVFSIPFLVLYLTVGETVVLPGLATAGIGAFALVSLGAGAAAAGGQWGVSSLLETPPVLSDEALSARETAMAF